MSGQAVQALVLWACETHSGEWLAVPALRARINASADHWRAVPDDLQREAVRAYGRAVAPQASALDLARLQVSMALCHVLSLNPRLLGSPFQVPTTNTVTQSENAT